MLALEEIGMKTSCSDLTSKQVERRLHVRRACCSVVRRLPIKAHVLSLLFGQIVQPGLLRGGRSAVASATRRCICSVEFFA